MPAPIRISSDPRRPIAVVDDNSDDRFFIKHEMEFLFGETPVMVFPSGTALIQYLHDHTQEHEKPALILLDLHMAGLTGLSILGYLRHRSILKDIPIIVVSGTLDKRDVQEALNYGADAFLPKPLQRGDFLKAITGKRIEMELSVRPAV